MQTLKLLEDAMHQKEQALIQYIRYMREAQDRQDTHTAALFADLAKAEEKHITVIRNQVAKSSGNMNSLNKYQQTNEYTAQHFDDITEQ
jgi:rubrerythrin